MARTRLAYPPGFRHKMVELVRAGRSPRELAQEFEPCYGIIRGWVKGAECLWPDQRGAGEAATPGTGALGKGRGLVRL